MKILIVEDDREAADYLDKAFAEAGHTAHLARDGETGFALADAGDYDVMVVDRMLPRRDGLSLIDGLRSRMDEHRATEVVVATHALNRMLELGRPSYVRIA